MEAVSSASFDGKVAFGFIYDLTGFKVTLFTVREAL